MIIVIADDFTGAAELAGISLRYGLAVSLCMHEIVISDHDVIIVCTDSRSLGLNEAKRITAKVLEQLKGFEPDLIYKKIDSVLRGYVIEELKVQLEQTDIEKVFILPENPSLGRTIVNGEYFIDDKKIDETGFAFDPEFPIKSSRVTEMIKADGLFVLPATSTLPGKGIVIGEAASGKDIQLWASCVDNSWILAGGGDFYNALLEKKYKPVSVPPVEISLPHLYVCGTAFKERKTFIKMLEANLGCVVYLPEVIGYDWLNMAGLILQKQQRLIIAIDNSQLPALALRTMMATAVRAIVESETVKEIFIEGGSTAAAVLSVLNIQQFSPLNELQRGVVRMKANDLFITVKPGSYLLPTALTDIYPGEEN